MEKKQKGVSSNIIIVLLILLVLALSSIGIYAWAKYRTVAGGTATAQVARWNFTLVDGIAETTDVIDFAVTRTDENPKVEAGTLAPGTYGEFEIGIDARETETILEYDIEISLGDKPTNLKLYSDSERTVEILVEDNKIALNGFMSLEDVKEIRVEKIYWEWPFQTGETEDEQLENDLIDTEFLGKTMTMEIAVTGFEVLEAPIYLADVVQVGDYVNYDASSNGVKTFTSGDCLAGTSISGTISTANSFNSSAPAQWRVLSVDKEKGVVELMAADPTAQTVTLSGGDGFINAETVLNNVGSIYGQGKGATGGRSITLEDVEQYSSYVPSIGSTITYTSKSFYKEIKDENGNVTGYETTTTQATSSNPVTMTQTVYEYNALSYFSNSIIYNMIFKDSSTPYKPTYWLASRCVHLYPGYCLFCVNAVFWGELRAYNSYDSRGSTGSPKYNVVPVVSLKSNILTTGKDESGVWQLKVD